MLGTIRSFNLQISAVAAAAKSLQSCPTLCDTIDGSPPGSPVPGILQATVLEWVSTSFSNKCYMQKFILFFKKKKEKRNSFSSFISQ